MYKSCVEKDLESRRKNNPGSTDISREIMSLITSTLPLNEYSN
jgi:hypothetical protein